jgi:hypothetical protein
LISKAVFLFDVNAVTAMKPKGCQLSYKSARGVVKSSEVVAEPMNLVFHVYSGSGYAWRFKPPSPNKTTHLA